MFLCSASPRIASDENPQLHSELASDPELQMWSFQHVVVLSCSCPLPRPALSLLELKKILLKLTCCADVLGTHSARTLLQ